MSDQKHILNALIDYVQEKTTDYALLVNGDWGAGKTFFWKNRVVPEILAVGKKHLYISLYGVKSATDIDRLLLIAQYPFLKNGMFEVASKLSQSALDYFKIKLPFDSIKADVSNSVICFDDLERVECEIGEVLGYINAFCEHENVKVIVMAHEKEIVSQGDKTTPHARYPKIKEKIFRFTYHFSADIESAVDAVIERVSHPDLRSSLNTNRRRIINTLKSAEIKNIRALKSAIAMYEKLWIVSVAKDTNRNSNVWAGILMLLIGASLKIKQDSNNRDLLGDLFSFNWFAYGFRGGDDSDAKGKFLDNFENIYFSANSVRLPKVPSVLKFATIGLLNEGEFIDELLKETDSQSERPVMLDELFFEQYWRLTDDQLVEVTQKQIGFLIKGEISSTLKLLVLAQRLFFFETQQLLDCDSSQLKKYFVESIELLIKTKKLEFSDLENDQMVFLNNVDNVDYIFVCDVLKKADFDLGVNEIKSALTTLFSGLGKNVLGTTRNFHETYPNLAFKPVLIHVPIETFETAIDEMLPFAIFDFLSFIENRYEVSNIYEYLSPECVLLEGLKDFVDKKISANSNLRLTNFALRRLAEGLTKAISKLKHS